MKKILLLSAILFFKSALIAQSITDISEQEFTYSTGKKECMKLTFKDVNATNLETALVDYFKKNYKAKVASVKKTDGEFEVEEFKATDIQQKLSSAILKIQELEGNAILYIHYKSDGYVVSSKNTPDLYSNYKSLSQRIGELAISYSYNDVIELRNKDLSAQEKELATYVKSENKQSDFIDKANSEIEASKSSIKSFEADLVAQKSLVIEKEKLVEDKKLEMATVNVKSLEKNIKEIEGDTKKANKEIEGVNKEIASKNAEIAKLQSEIVTLESTIEPTNVRIAENKTKIESVNKQIADFNEDALKDQLKMLEKDAKSATSEQGKIVKSIDKENASILKNTSKIKDSKAEIENIKVSQKEKQVEIEATKSLLKELKNKVAKLK